MLDKNTLKASSSSSSSKATAPFRLKKNKTKNKTEEHLMKSRYINVACCYHYMHGGLAPSLTWCFHGDRSTGFSPLLVALWKSPLGYLTSLRTESLSRDPRRITCTWNWSVCTWLSWWPYSALCATERTMGFRLIWSLGLIAWMVGIVWEVEWSSSAVAMAPAHCVHWAWKMATRGFAFSLFFLLSLSSSLFFSLALWTSCGVTLTPLHSAVKL